MVSLDLMRTQIARVTVLIWCWHVFVLDALAEYKSEQATNAYRDSTSEIAHRAIDTELFKHPERLLGVSMKITYQIDRSGHVQNVTIVAGHRNRWAEKTVQRVLAGLKLPPIPNDVLREMGMDHIDAVSTWSYATSRSRDFPIADLNAAVSAYKMATRPDASIGPIEVISHDEIRIYQDSERRNYTAMVRRKGKWVVGSVVLVHPR